MTCHLELAFEPPENDEKGPFTCTIKVLSGRSPNASEMKDLIAHGKDVIKQGVARGDIQQFDADRLIDSLHRLELKSLN